MLPFKEKHVRWQLLRVAFAFWRQRCQGPSLHDFLDSPWHVRARVVGAWNSAKVGRLAVRLKELCHEDRAIFVEGLADQIDKGDCGVAYEALHKLLGHRRKKPFSLEVLPALKKLDGTFCEDGEQIRLRWREHFSALEAGEEVCPEALVQQAVMPKHWVLPETLSLLPNELELADALRNAKVGKATGGDMLPHGLGKACPVEMSKVMQPLSLKLGLRGCEAIGMKAGLLHHMFKGRGDRSSCSAHRGILLLSSLGKCVHRTLRPRLARHFDAVADPCQLGGRVGKTTAFAAHTVRTYIRDKVRRNVSGAVVFADIAAAYYSAARELTASRVSEAEADELCAGVPIAPEDREELKRHLQEIPAMQMAKAGTWLCNITAELNSQTWMGLANDPGPPIRTKRGTRPGSAFADITFGLLLKRVLNVRRTMRPQGEHQSEPSFLWDGRKSFLPTVGSAGCRDVTAVALSDVIWADDLAACLHCEAATQVSVSVGTEIGCMADSFAQHGLVLAYGPHKTAAVCTIRGQGSRQVRKQLFGHASEKNVCTLPVLRENQGPDCLPLMHGYRHLGVWQTSDGTIKMELSQRIGQAWAAFREARRKVFKCKLVGLQRKAVLLRGLIFAKLLVGAGRWPPMRDGEARTFQACVVSMMRQILCVPRSGQHHLHFCSLCAKTGLCSPSVMLHKERLIYAVQLVRHGPDVLWAALKGDTPYCELMMGSFDWLFSRIQRTCPLRHPRQDWDSWRELMGMRPNRFKGWVKRACGLQQCVLQCMAAHVEIHSEWRQRALPKDTMNDGPSAQACTDACVPCKKAFCNLAAWASHAACKHGFRARSTLTAKGSLCLGCRKSFANQHRLKRHLDHFPSCVARWGAFQPVRGAQDPGSHVLAPPVLAEGMLDLDFEVRDLSICEELEAELYGLTAGTSFQVLDVVAKHIAPLALLRRTVERWHDSLPQHHPLKEALP